MRRLFSLTLVLMACLLTTASAVAGKVSYVDGMGQWVPTGCLEPKAPAALPANSEAAANVVNARVADHNAYVTAVEKYMACVSDEAQHDAQAFGQLITGSAQKIIDQAQKDVAASASRTRAKPAVQ